MGREQEAATVVNTALQNAKPAEVHNYGRQLLAQNKVDKAMEIFQFNFTKTMEPGLLMQE